LPSPSTISTAGLAPGVRFQWIARPAAPGAPRTDIAGFVGIAERGDLHVPTRIESPAQFTSTFGRSLPGAYLADAVEAFFANGGSTCWIVRVANPDTATPATLDLTYPNSETVAVQLRATSPGTWAHRMMFTYVDLGGGQFTLTLELPDEGLAEQWRAVSFSRGDSRSIDQVLEGSALVAAWILEDRISTVDGGSSDAARIDLLDGAGSPIVRLELKGTPTWEQRVQVTVSPDPASGTFELSLDPADPNVPNPLRNLTLGSVTEALANSTLLQASGIVSPFVAPTPGDAAAPVPRTGFSGGRDGLDRIKPDHFIGEGSVVPIGDRWGLAALELIDEISIVAMPDAARLSPVPAAAPKPLPADCAQLTEPAATPPEVDEQFPAQYPDIGNQSTSAASGTGEVTSLSVNPLTRNIPVGTTFQISGDPNDPRIVFTTNTLTEVGAVTLPVSLSQSITSSIAAGEIVPVFAPLTFAQPDVLDLNNALIRHCAQLQDRVAVLDPPAPGWNPDQVIEWRTNFTSSYGALYFPWLLTLTVAGEIKTVPPSGAVAGILARVSLRDSVAKPPANESVEGVAALPFAIDDLTHSRLNEYSVNAIRTISGRGLRILGARTCLATPGLAAGLASGQQPSLPDASGLGFLNVRRVVAMVEAVVGKILQFAVFEANVALTWRAIERSVRIFLDGLWRAGGLDGATAADAYLVRCDKTTNPDVFVDEGRLTCLVGIRPPWPAEFVFVRVSATAAGTQVQESGAGA
jgi:hypothetical protein